MNVRPTRILSYSRPVRLLPVLLVALLVSCGESGDTPPGELDAVTHVTEQQCRAFAEEVEKTISVRNPEFVNAAMDLESMFHTITRDISTTEQDYQDFKTEVPPGFGFGNQLVKSLETQGVFRMIHFRWDGGKPKALYRVIVGDGEFTYYDLYLGERGDSQVVIKDVYLYVTGELFTEAVRRIVVADQAGPLRKLFAAATGKEVGVSAATDTLLQLTKGGQYSEALNYYDKLPADVKDNKTVQILRIGAAQKASDAYYEKVLDEVSRQFGGTSSIDLILLDHYTFKNQQDSTRAVIERLDKNLGGDPYLDFARASVDIQQNMFAPAREKLLKVIAYDSTLIAPHWALVNVSLKQQDHPETARLLTVIEDRLGIAINPEAVATDTTYANFARSDAFKAWADARQ